MRPRRPRDLFPLPGIHRKRKVRGHDRPHGSGQSLVVNEPASARVEPRRPPRRTRRMHARPTPPATSPHRRDRPPPRDDATHRSLRPTIRAGLRASTRRLQLDPAGSAPTACPGRHRSRCRSRACSSCSTSARRARARGARSAAPSVRSAAIQFGTRPSVRRSQDLVERLRLRINDEVIELLERLRDQRRTAARDMEDDSGRRRAGTRLANVLPVDMHDRSSAVETRATVSCMKASSQARRGRSARSARYSPVGCSAARTGSPTSAVLRHAVEENTGAGARQRVLRRRSDRVAAGPAAFSTVRIDDASVAT